MPNNAHIKEERQLVKRCGLRYPFVREDSADAEEALEKLQDETLAEAVQIWDKYHVWLRDKNTLLMITRKERAHKWYLRLQREIEAWEAKYKLGAEVRRYSLLEDKTKRLLDKAISIQENDPNPQLATQYAICFKAWSDARGKLDAAKAKMESEVQRFERMREQELTQRSTFEAIYRDYHGQGEVYRLLCHRIAAVATQMEFLEKDGKMGVAEHVKAQQEFRSLIDQVQKHTESTKTEVQEAHLFEFGDKIMKVVERHLQHQPLIFKRIVQDVEAGNFEDAEIRLVEAPAS